MDWESCHRKYLDIALAFCRQYTSGDMAVGKDFSHNSSSISHGQLAANLKAVRNKYRHAVESGHPSGHGRVVLIFFELCEEIWGGSSATTTFPSGVETADLTDSSSSSSWPTSSATRPTLPDANLDSAQDSTVDSLPPAVVRRRRHLLQVGLLQTGVHFGRAICCGLSYTCYRYVGFVTTV